MNKQIPRNIVFIGLFLIPFIPFLVYSGFFFPFIVTKVFTWRIIVEIIFAAWLLLALLDVDYRPRRSIILYSLFSFLVIIGLADILGIAPVSSFWSNFERMEGFVSLLHLGMFFLVISSVFKEVDWKRWWNTTLVASAFMVVYSAFQIFGAVTINQGGVRVDGTLGNAIYLAVYMLFQIFVAMLFFYRERKSVSLRWVYGLLILAQLFVLYHTATRGAILGLLGGLFITAILNIRNKEDRAVRKWSAGILVALVALAGVFFVIRNTTFVAQSPVLSRFSYLSLDSIKTQGRYFVWPMAVEGFKENPLLGWGQENFIYVFQKYYSPEMYYLEPWFDRAHNIFLDWMVAGGALGLLAYLALYATILLSIWKRHTNLSHTEKSILTGLIAAYFFHNFFVFDHLISYILFFSLLAYVHYRDSGEVFWTRTITEVQVKRVALPAVAILLALSLYFVNIKPIITNVFVIKAFKALQTPGQVSTSVLYFERAHRASLLGRSEVVEHLAGNSVAILQSDIPMTEKNEFFNFAKAAVIREALESSKNARYQLLAGSFLSTTGYLDDALSYLVRAKELMPNKQQIYFEIGAAYINKNEPLKALEAFRIAYEIAPAYQEAKIIYLLGAIYAGDQSLENRLLLELPKDIVSQDSRVQAAYRAVGR